MERRQSVATDLSLTMTTFVTSIVAFTVTAFFWNALRQIFFKNTSKPPVVFHWIPFIGSTVTYGIDPYRFFFRCQAKVSVWAFFSETEGANLERSTETYSPSYYSVGESPSIWAPREIGSYSMGN